MIALLLNRWVIGLVASLVLMAGGYFAWQRVVEGYRAEGRAEMKAKMQPQLDSAIAALAESQKAMAALKENSERLKGQAAQAQKVKIVRQDVEKARIADIDRIVPTGATECDRTSDAIKKVLR